MSKALVVLSGGQDSTTCLYWALRQYDKVVAVTFDYGQRHAIEIEAAREIAEHAGIEWELVRIPPLGGDSPLTELAREVRQYESADALPGGIEDTFVPGRNIIFLALAANRAASLGCEIIIAGLSQEDFGGYPDCRRVFVDAMEKAVNLGLEGTAAKIVIETPLINMSKKETVLLAQEVGAMEALALSHTCYNGERPPCGHCHACLLRLKGFEEAGVEDPLLSGS
jgi:7-cyano-7-deazaguanine synthase